MIISRTPFRISFFGGGTDYPAWYRQHGGAVLATTINKYCYLSCRRFPPFFEHRYRIVYSKAEDCQTIDEIAHPAVRETLRYLKIEFGLEIHHNADLPARSGLGSSSAFTVGLLHALYGLKGLMPSKRQLALESIHIEQELIKDTVGSQDQVLAAYGGFNHISFLPSGEIVVKPVTAPSERLAELNAHLMLFYTGIRRTASTVAQSYVRDIENKEPQMRALLDLVEEGSAILAGDQDIIRFGKLLHEAWRAKRSLSSDVSNDFIDTIYAQAFAAGAVGGKVIGAGGGGFLLFFVPPSKRSAVRQRLSSLIHVPFNFERSGSHIAFFDPDQDYVEEEQDRAMRSIVSFRELSDLTPMSHHSAEM